jgi:hypothetical protein
MLDSRDAEDDIKPMVAEWEVAEIGADIGDDCAQSWNLPTDEDEASVQTNSIGGDRSSAGATSRRGRSNRQAVASARVLKDPQSPELIAPRVCTKWKARSRNCMSESACFRRCRPVQSTPL